MQAPLSFWQQVLMIILVPPIAAVAWAAFSRGWANTVQGGKISERTRKRQKVEFWAVLAFGYVMLFAIFVNAHFYMH